MNSDEKPIKFEWELVHLETMRLHIQCTFDRPLAVSQGSTLDDVYLYFRTDQGPEGRGKEEWHKLTGKIPMQLPSQTAAD